MTALRIHLLWPLVGALVRLGIHLELCVLPPGYGVRYWALVARLARLGCA